LRDTELISIVTIIVAAQIIQSSAFAE